MEPLSFWMMIWESPYVMVIVAFCLFLFTVADAPEGGPVWHGLFSVVGVTFVFSSIYSLALIAQMLSPNTWLEGTVKSIDKAELVSTRRGVERSEGSVPFLVVEASAKKADKASKGGKKTEKKTAKNSEYIVSYLYSVGRPTVKKGDKCAVCVEKGLMGTKVIRFRHNGTVYRTAARL